MKELKETATKTTLQPKQSYVAMLTSSSLSGLALESTTSNITYTGDGYKAIKIPHALYKERLKSWKHSIIGIISLVKGDSPWGHIGLKLKLNGTWGCKVDWKLISLGRGCYHIIIPSAEAVQRVWNIGHLNLRPGIMRFLVWKAGVDLTVQRQTTSQV